MAIRLTGGGDVYELARWCVRANQLGEKTRVGCPACAPVAEGPVPGPGCEQCEGRGWVWLVANVTAEIYVDPRGWYLRVPGLEDFIIEPDVLELSSDERDPTASEVEELRAELIRERLAR